LLFFWSYIFDNSGKADSTRINAIGDAAALKIKAEAEAFRILEVAKAQEEAGKMFEKVNQNGRYYFIMSFILNRLRLLLQFDWRKLVRLQFLGPNHL
jgi:hypothetical protein